MKVLFIASDNTETSGAFLCMRDLCVGLREKYQIDTMAILPFEGTGSALLDKDGIPYKVIRSFDGVYKSGTPKNILYYAEIFAKSILNTIAIFRLLRYLKKNKIDLVHINTSYTYIGAVSSLLAGTPYVWHIREFGKEDQRSEFYFPRIMYFLMNSSEKVICISNAIRNKYSPVLKDKKIEVVYDGLDPQRYYYEREILSKDKYVFLIAGTIKETKGQRILLEACGQILSSFHDFEIWIAGTGPEKEVNVLKKIVAKYHMEKNVRFWGFVSEIEKLQKQSDIVFMCSAAEAFGRVTVEGMLSGNLVIGSNRGCTSEIICDGKNGLLYKFGDEKSLGNKILYAVKHREKAREMAKIGQKEALERYSINTNLCKIDQIYQDIVLK